MANFTDFKAGLQNANDYMAAKHHITGTLASGDDALRIVGSAQYSFTLRELLCGVLSGNGLKLPNIQICMYANIQELLKIPNLQAELYDALSSLDSAMTDFMNHTSIDNVLGRLNSVLSEAQNVANLINFCGKPIDPIAIPNMLENAFGSFLGAGKDLIDQIGSIAPENVCACIGTGGFNSNVFDGGVLGTIANNIDAINAGSLPQSVIDSIKSDIDGVTSGISQLIDFENNINGAYSQGGSQFAIPDSGCNSEVGVLHNPQNSTVSDNARITSSLKALYDNLAGYPVRYRVTGTGGTDGGGTDDSGDTNGDSSASSTDAEYIEYPNIFHLLLEPEFLELISQADDPNPDVTNQIPVYDYCGTVIGYTTQYVQGSDETSQGTEPTAPNSPGYLAGGLTTTESGTTTANTISGTVTTTSSRNETFLSATTTTNTVTVVPVPAITSGKSWFFELNVIARSNSNSGAWKLEGVIQDINGIQSIIGNVSKNDYQANTNWDVSVAVNSANKIEVRIQGEANITVNWGIKHQYVEV